jgi:hypothetical protein
MILLKSSESFQKTRATMIYNITIAEMTYSEEERAVGHSQGEASNAFLYSSIWLVVAEILNEKKEDQVVD